MKKFYSLLIAAIFTLAIPMGMWGQASVGTTLWSETWQGGSAGDTPSDYGFEGTTVYGEATLTYTQDDSGTKLYNEKLAGGTAPELLLKSGNKTWTISNIPTGQATEMSLTFKSNKTTFTVTSSTNGISISGSQKSWTITATSVSSFNLTIKNTGSSNARIDDIELKVTTAGSGGSTPTTYTVTFDAGDGSFVGNTDFPNASNSVTAGTYTLPSATPATGYTFDGWAMGETTYQAGASYTVSGNADFVASYTENTTPTPGGETATLNIEAYADANNWVNGTKYATATVSPVTFTANGGGNTGKYYTSGEEWRFYQSENASITISVAEGYTLVSVTPTYSVSNSGVLKNGNATIKSGTTVNVSGTSVTFTVGNSGTATNGQVKFTNINVTYISDGGSQTTSDLAITGDPVALNFDLYNNSSAQTVSYTTSSTGAITITPATPNTYFSYVHDAENKTITVTPLAVTPSAQTVTIDQAADDDYYAGTATFTVSVANSTPLANIAALTSQTAGNYNVALSNAIVTYVNGSNAYIQDASGAVAMHKSDHGLTAGDVLNGNATVAYQLYSGNPQITNLTGVTPVSGTAPNPTEVAQSAWSYTFNNVLSQYFKITGATITQSNNKYYVSLNNESIQLYKQGGSISTLDLSKTYSITGFPTLYNSTKELTIYAEPEVEATAEPSVTVTPNTINAPAANATGSLTLTYENITDFISFDFKYCDAQGNELEDTDPNIPDWIHAEINEENDSYTLDYLIDANAGAARTAYIKVLTFDDSLNEVYAIVTVNQAQYVVDYATLPFEWEGGLPTAFDELNGTTLNDVDSYPNQTTYQMKLDNDDDYIQVKTDSQPGVVTVGVKMVGGNATSTLTVQGSYDGENFTNIQSFTISGAQNSTHEFETSNAFGSTDRYVRLLFTKGNGSNVGVGPISIAQYVEPVIVPTITVDPDEVSVDAEEHDGTLGLTYTALEISDMEDFGVQFYDAEGEETSEPDWIEVLVAEQDSEIGEGYVVSYYMLENEDEARTAYFKVFAAGGEDFVYSNLVTITQAAPEAPVTGKYVKVTSAADLTSGQYLIVYEDGNLAFDGSLGTLDATSNTIGVTLNNGEIAVTETTTASEFTINTTAGTIKSASGFFIGQTSDANGLVAQEDELTNTISFDEDGNANILSSGGAYLRYNSATNQTRFRYFKSSTYTGQHAIQLYKKVVEPATETYELTITGYGDDDDAQTGWRLIASPVAIAPEDVTNMTTNTYDLYKFNEENSMWYNYKANANNQEPGFNLVPGEGYLYAHSGDSVKLTFVGVPYSGNGKVTLSEQGSGTLAGWNLVGNPFGDSNAIIVVGQDDPAREFYRMNAEGSDVALASGSIAAMEGVFVVANEDEEEITFEETDAPVSNAKGSAVVMNLSQNNGVIDRAIVHFDESKAMPKFQLFENSTKLYIAQNGEDYASVRSEAQGEMPVNFVAKENGQYTISINAENVEMNYLHLIDNMTGANVDLLANPSYTFNANTTDYASRFRLVFSANGVNEDNDNFAFINNGQIILTGDNSNATLQVIDMTGRIIFSHKDGVQTVSTNGMAPGVYVLQLINGNDVKTQKIVVR